MTSTEKLAIEIAPLIDPAARPPRRNDGEWQIWLGWAAAAMLHASLLAVLIFSWPARLNPAPPNPTTLSLLIVAADNPARQLAVRPKPPEEQAVIPATAPVKIATSSPERTPKPNAPAPSPSVSTRLSAASPIQPAPSGMVETKTVTQQDGDGFVAARPFAGSVNQKPEYPPAAYDHGEQGDVLLSIHVLPDGEADSVSVTQTSGYRILDEAAAKAVWKWRFQPSTLSGQKVPSVIPYRINFNLQDAP